MKHLQQTHEGFWSCIEYEIKTPKFKHYRYQNCGIVLFATKVTVIISALR